MPMYKRSMAVLLAVAAAMVGIGLYGCYGDAGQELAAAEETAAEGARQGNISQVAVYVTGEVNTPGVVYVDFDGRVVDAVNLCGGLLPTADVSRVNMAQTVKDGMQVNIPAKLPPPLQPSADTGTQPQKNSSASQGTGSRAEDGLVNINTADAAALEKLKGIGPAMAQRIVDYREANGAFQRVEDLQKVKGIGKAKLARLKEQAAI